MGMTVATHVVELAISRFLAGRIFCNPRVADLHLAAIGPIIVGKITASVSRICMADSGKGEYNQVHR
jgi:hypothetical protein